MLSKHKIFEIILDFISLLLTNALLTEAEITTNEECSININADLTFKHPLILEATSNEFVMPNMSDGHIWFAHEDQVRLACPGNANQLAIVPGVQEVNVTCNSGHTFTLSDGTSVPFRNLSCALYPKASAQRTGRSCVPASANPARYIEIAIGFDVSTGFVPIITTCFDDARKDSLYSVYTLSALIGYQQHSVPRPKNFATAGFYDRLVPKPAALYTRKDERITFGKLLHSTQLANKYISLTTDYFLSHGHLTPRDAFIYGSQQRATFFYVNVAPQWETFNSQNWNALEASCRQLATDRQLDFVVYTGIYGNSSLSDVNEVQQNVSLSAAANDGSGALTVPEVYWKLVYEPQSRAGVAFVGHNNPYETNVTDKMLCSHSVCDQIEWVSWDPINVIAGFAYCCQVDELRSIIPYLPNVTVDSLLI